VSRQEETMKESRSSKKIAQSLGIFTLGAAVGSLSALLFTPASGRAIRKRIGNQLRQAKKLLAKKADLLRENAVEKLGDTRQWLVQRVLNGNGNKHSIRRRVAHHA